MEKAVFIFVYAKDNKIIVLGIDDARERHKDLLALGYLHTQTLDACVFIQYLHNDCDEFNRLLTIDSLSEKSK
jgi:hypothetical protein